MKSLSNLFFKKNFNNNSYFIGNKISRNYLQTKCVRIHENGKSDVLTTETIDVPKLNDNEVLIENEYAGLNFIDTYHRSGLYPLPFPSILGVEGCGIIKEMSSKFEDFNIGDRVAYYQVGSYSKFVNVLNKNIVKVPDNVSSQMATACIVQGMTAHYLTRSTFPLKDGDVCVIHAAAGGVGQLVVQIAKILGATVIGTASSKEKCDLAMSLGCDYCVNYNELQDTVMKVTGKAKGIDVVYDGVGKSTFDTSLSILRPRGMCVFYGNASGPVPELNVLRLAKEGSIFITRPTLAGYMLTRDEFKWRGNELFDWISKDKLKIKIDKEFSLENVKDGHEYIENGLTTGKVLFKC